MSRFNTRSARPTGTSPVRSTDGTRTEEGGAGWLRDTRSELFLLAVAHSVGTDTFYEAAGDRDSRFVDLLHRLAVDVAVMNRPTSGASPGPDAQRHLGVLVTAPRGGAQLRGREPAVHEQQLPP